MQEENQFSRLELMYGPSAVEKLQKSRVAVFGVGGVGGYVVEALARSGLGAIDIIDNDTVAPSNLNRQIIALHSTIGLAKVDVAEERIHDINPNCKVYKHKCFFLPETSNLFDFSQYDYVADCIDTVSGKIRIIEMAKEANVPVISCMGAGNKNDPTKFQIADISQTSVCPLARVMRRELKARNITGVKVVFSTEKPTEILASGKEASATPASANQTTTTPADQTLATTPDKSRSPSSKKIAPGSNAFTPSVAGLILASQIIKDLI